MLLSPRASTTVAIGTAGWAIPGAFRDRFRSEGSQLARYSGIFSAVEINSSFKRHHKPATYARWAESVGSDFRFCVKLPRSVTHERRLIDTGEEIGRFAGEIQGLGAKLAVILIQTPPSLAFDPAVAADFFSLVRALLPVDLACEPRHASWFSDAANSFLIENRVARVAADPAPVPAAAKPGGWPHLAYFRLHGRPRIYWSSYDTDAVNAHARAIAGATTSAGRVWAIYDNTAAGAATGNGLELRERLAEENLPA